MTDLERGLGSLEFCLEAAAQFDVLRMGLCYTVAPGQDHCILFQQTVDEPRPKGEFRDLQVSATDTVAPPGDLQRIFMIRPYSHVN